MRRAIGVVQASSTSAALLVACLLAACAEPEVPSNETWSPETAAGYLDQRVAWWMRWRMAARDHETFCVSCHTAVPYAMSRAALRESLGETTQSPNELQLMENVRKRVHLWARTAPYYSEGRSKREESRGTEAVLNALILSCDDAQRGRLSSSTRASFHHMWALQGASGDRAGAWSWLDFGLRPWEAKDSAYYGAALAAAAVGIAPEDYRATPGIQGNLSRLRAYLEHGYPEQSLLNRVVLLWASAQLPNVLGPERRDALIQEILREQRWDGGWSVSSLDRQRTGMSLRSFARSWVRSDLTLVDGSSDGYATGLVTFALLQAGADREDSRVKRGLLWLRRNQNRDTGHWPASSLNKQRSPSSNRGRFMSDAATAYAVLALNEADRTTRRPPALAVPTTRARP